ncbi:MAG: cytochrome c [Chloroflexota bacterium]|nr:cytochrome c [Chloroflexota bacterium]
MSLLSTSAMMRRLLLVCVAILAVGVACEEPPAKEPVARGRQVFRKLDCARCHFIDGQGGHIGPDLTHVATNAATRREGVSAEDYIRQSILDPGAYVVPGYNDVMPRGLARNLPPSDLDALVAYLLAHK